MAFRLRGARFLHHDHAPLRPPRQTPRGQKKPPGGKPGGQAILVTFLRVLRTEQLTPPSWPAPSPWSGSRRGGTPAPAPVAGRGSSAGPARSPATGPAWL